MLRIFTGLLIMIASSCLLLSEMSYADSIGHSEARALREAGKILPLEEIIEKAKRFKPGKVIDTELEKDDGIYVYEIEVLDDRGWVWEMEFDASTGELLKLELDD
jgi:uncharacterized membrane protein YkoI